MEITINIKDYLSIEEIKDECRYAIRHSIMEKYKRESEIDRLISNLGYEFIFKAIQETTGEDTLQKIKDTVIQLANQADAVRYLLFKAPDKWDSDASIGYTIVQQALEENEPLIKEKVKDAISDYDFLSRKDLQDRMEDLFHEMLEEKLFHTSN
jgi:hypothetical protein